MRDTLTGMFHAEGGEKFPILSHISDDRDSAARRKMTFTCGSTERLRVCRGICSTNWNPTTSAQSATCLKLIPTKSSVEQPCGARGNEIDVRPNWKEQPRQPSRPGSNGGNTTASGPLALLIGHGRCRTLCVPRVVPKFRGNQNTGVCISTFGKCNWSCEERAHVPEPNSGTFFDSIRRLYCPVRFRRSRFILARLTMCS